MSQKEKRPNILFAIADDASHMGAYGHDFVNTPNFDRVAKEGILFENAFTSNPKCAPLKQKLWQELKQKLKETNDPRIFENGAVFEKYEPKSYKSHSWKAYEEGWWKPQSY